MTSLLILSLLLFILLLFLFYLSNLLLHCFQTHSSYHTNIGDSRSLIVNSPKTTHGELTPEEKEFSRIESNTIRLSIGLEDAEDLIWDLEQAFEKTFSERPQEVLK